MTLEKKIELLKAMEEHAFSMYDMHKADGEAEEARRYMREHIVFHTAIEILENDKFAGEMAEIFIGG